MKISTLYKDINPKFLPKGLKEIHDLIPKSNAAGRYGIRMTFLSPILEARAAECLFWLVPDKEGWRVLFFETSYFKWNMHNLLWKDVAAEVVANAFGREATEDFKELWRAYPRGRVHDIDGVWMVAYGDLPPGWNEEKLMFHLNVRKGTIKADDHWLSNPDEKRRADSFLGIKP